MDHRIRERVAILALAALGAACAHTSLANRSRDGAPASPALPGSPSGLVYASEPDVRGDTLRAIPELKTVLFRFDTAALSDETRAALVSNADWLKAHEDVRVQVAGNCDERGTIAYNLALGQKRAAAVRDYYLRLGVPGERVATISYGKERPVCSEQGESCWHRNRRADTLRAVALSVGAVSRP